MAKATLLGRGFSRAARQYLASLRRLLPQAVMGSTTEAMAARRQLEQAADKLSLQLKSYSAVWLKTKPLVRAAANGSRRAGDKLGLKFGGVNQTLTAKLTMDVARDLGRAAASPRLLLGKQLREATVIGAKIKDELTPLTDPNRTLSLGLLQGAIRQETFPQASKTLLKAMGLDKGDRVIFLSGRTMGAKAYADLVVRTRTLEALNEGAADRLQSDGFLYVETSSHDGVDEDDICYLLQGRVWALGPNPLGIPILPPEYGLPPWHPNCRHTIAPWIPELQGKDAVAKVLAGHVSLATRIESFDGRTYRPKEK